MRWKLLFILAALLAVPCAETIGSNASAWIGRSFIPRRCLALAEGSWDVKHKLCTIHYDIRPKGNRFDVKGRIRFDKRQVPINVSEVELEILLIDENHVCTRQLDQRVKVRGLQADFAFTAENKPSQRYVRTYYIIYYRQD